MIQSTGNSFGVNRTHLVQNYTNTPNRIVSKSILHFFYSTTIYKPDNNYNFAVKYIANMKELYNTYFQIDKFAETLECPCYQKDIAIAHLNANNISKFNNIAEEMFLTTSKENIESSIIVQEGEVSVTIDYVNYNVTASHILHINPLKILTQLQLSENFRGLAFINSRAILDETILNRKPPVSISEILASDKSPYRKLSQSDSDTLLNCIGHIEHYVKQPEHRLKKELICSTLYILILESAKIIFSNANTSVQSENQTKKTYIEKFIKLLIQFADREHNPAFYADKLCISVQYLSLILKEVSGKTANAWIAGYLINRAKVLLRNPENTIQQIAETLSFSDQSSFGKFFKKHTGISPRRYKEEH